MNAVKREVVIGKDRRIVIDLPSDTPEGPAEVIVLVPEERRTDVDALLAGTEEWRRTHPEHRRTREEIDRQLAEERGSWSRETSEVEKTIKMQVTIPEDRTLVVKLPEDTLPGAAEVIILQGESPARTTGHHALIEIANEWRSRNPERRSKEEIDRYLEEERASWDDDR